MLMPGCRYAIHERYFGTVPLFIMLVGDGLYDVVLTNRKTNYDLRNDSLGWMANSKKQATKNCAGIRIQK
ncbi:hypothetical protein EYC84_004494 [Monilinia fructicola]|uniref:Uncharacterized protein n=1 Tax=Monilinia fructicola TaxID=38448 RepID=A0A5M9K331_MONFR|nr:hypothetical protein EYC84_004494 [Monilinia fructicola]